MCFPPKMAHAFLIDDLRQSSSELSLLGHLKNIDNSTKEGELESVGIDRRRGH